MKTFKTMLKTELKLSLRGMDMFIVAICVPLAVLAVMGIFMETDPHSAVPDTHFWNSRSEPSPPYPSVQEV